MNPPSMTYTIQTSVERDAHDLTFSLRRILLRSEGKGGRFLIGQKEALGFRV